MTTFGVGFGGENEHKPVYLAIWYDEYLNISFSNITINK